MSHLLHTHAHFDHVGATKALQDYYQCPSWLHDQDNFLIEHLDDQCAYFNFPLIPKPEMKSLEEENQFLGFSTLHTPGHTPGSCCFYGEYKQGTVMLAGDTLFNRSVGRTDTPGGSKEQLVHSIKSKLYTKNEETLVIPGHGTTTTIGSEKQHNPFVREYKSRSTS